jgi:adenylyl cyclase-associated protein
MEIRIVGKIKSVSLEGCKKVVLIVDSVVSDVNIMNSTNIKVFGNDQMKSVTAESTNELQVNLNHKNKNCKVITTCTRAVWIRYPKEGADDQDNDNINWNKQPVAEIYES